MANAGNEFRKGDLAGGRIAYVFAADNVGDSFCKVVDADGELVGPKAVAVADREVTALFFRIFGEIAETFVMPLDYFVWNHDAQAVWLKDVIPGLTGNLLSLCEKSFSALALINNFAGFTYGVFGLQLLAAASAGVHESFSGKLVENLLEKVKVAALDAFAVVAEAEPGQVFADAVDVFLAGAALVVVFDAQVNLEIPFLGGGPHVKCGEQVPFV